MWRVTLYQESSVAGDPLPRKYKFIDACWFRYSYHLLHEIFEGIQSLICTDFDHNTIFTAKFALLLISWPTRMLSPVPPPSSPALRYLVVVFLRLLYDSANHNRFSNLPLSTIYDGTS